MEHFKPAGERARWKYLYELLLATEDDGILTYQEMADALGLDVEADRQLLRVAFYRAAKEHEEVDKRAVKVIPNKGYRIVAPKEHLDLARKQHTRSSRALAKGQSKVVNVNMADMDPETRKAFEIMALGFAQQLDFNRRAERRLFQQEKITQELVQTSERSEEERREIRERVARLERRMLGQE